MVRTRVGYAGGSKLNPTYYDLGDHAETIQMDYDPRELTYEELLEVFWNSHRPTRPAWSRQYMSAIFYHNEEQKRLALASREREEERLNKKIYTEILPADAFYLAEDYHQKYSLRRHRQFVEELTRIYPNLEDFVDSTAVTRVNGYAGGHGRLADLKRELDHLGLSPSAREKLLHMGEVMLKE